MKYEEKQLRRRLKRRIWAMSVILFVLTLITVISWGTALDLEYQWQKGAVANHDLNCVELMSVRGAIVVGLVETRDVNIEEYFIKTFSVPDLGLSFISRKMTNYPQGPLGGSYFRFWGFERSYMRKHFQNRAVQFNTEQWTFIVPIWFLAIAPVCCLVFWSLKWKRSGRKLSAFPVEFPNNTNEGSLGNSRPDERDKSSATHTELGEQ